MVTNKINWDRVNRVAFEYGDIYCPYCGHQFEAGQALEIKVVEMGDMIIEAGKEVIDQFDAHAVICDDCEQIFVVRGFENT
jgi:hypothetical protein